MSIPFNKISVRIHLARLVANYKLLASKGSAIIPVVKADAYAHGLERVAPALWEAGARTFAVGTIEEAAFLRRHLPESRILSLLGPLDPTDFDLAWNADVIPFVSSFAQMEALQAEGRGRSKPLEIALKFDTGMARLGFTLDDVPAVVDRMKAASSLRAVFACSHLATADEPGNTAFVQRQADLFERIVSGLRAGGLPVDGCLANSGAILAHKSLHHEAQRAGIALYGVNPFQGTAWEEKGRGLSPAMDVLTKVVTVHPLRAGQSISYGCTYVAPRDMTVAIVAAGYADGYSRSLTNKGFMLIRGKRVPIVGRVCMQLTAVDISGLGNHPGGPVEPGEPVFLLGGEGPEAITPDDLAGWWGTITYEAFCLLGLNPREYV